MAIQKVEDLSKWRESMLDGLGGEGYEFALSWVDPESGERHHETFTVPHPLGLDEDANNTLEAATGTVAVAKALLNTKTDPRVHDRFIAAGGRSGDVLIAWRTMSAEMNAPK
ncbi:hypothetical protein [Gordonia soli]|uniref:Uncharacterized protein n=1 Tax=Gordonia soli NBRC 108243 TaxID=1223545 RepID=M0QR26_9ACTN|nr:hypothetical protein [Gordonia soli]GAC70726.1 hypothetical protein GS4_39_00570 [Gordonia soli NBRC 108243]